MTSDIQQGMTARYTPGDVESRWYAFWEEHGYFSPDMQSDAAPFCITIPPPNVTGELHLGHALTYGIEDVIGRFKRMQGYNTLILPGMDHAGIATQNVVEKQLAREGTSRHAVGRDAFVERVWAWKEQYGNNIRRQFQAMGVSFDWSRERFTMDPGYVDAVLEFFIRMFETGKIYRGWRVINWCPRCQSAISDIEVEDEERDDVLYYVRYPVVDGSGAIEVATVRPETILGDTGLAVHPEDERYREMVGREVMLPLMNRPLRVVADEMVDRSFGTGAVKITPAHDFADFEVAQRHGLEMPIAIGTDGRMTDVAGPYAGLTTSEARQRVVEDLERGGYLVRREPYHHVVPTCDRCGTLLEPLLSEQWFMRMKDLAAPAARVVRDGSVTFVPQRWAGVYLDWLDNIRDWTISRQLWWGHRIPVYYCENGHAVAAKSWPEACTQCEAPIVRQDDDVLDTWFSSALWPFAALGWPRDTEDLQRFYPTSFMNTSSQILYLWIARMVMTGLEFMHDIPFPVVLINPTILNHLGQRMSKSLGTGIDPLEMIRDYGADALRFGLLTAGSTHQQEIRFSAERVELARNFANKLWNVARFVVSNQGDEPGGLALSLADRWILSRLNEVTEAVTADLERFELAGAGQQLQDFLWNEFADWYVEIAKLRLFDEAGGDGRYTVRAVLWSVLDRVVRLIQPYMPFIAEEIWQHVRDTGSDDARQLSGWTDALPSSVMIAPWPVGGERDVEAERSMNLVMEIIRAVRATRAEYRVEPGRYLSASLAGGPETPRLLQAAEIIGRLARLEPMAVYDVIHNKPDASATIMAGTATVYIPLAEMTDVGAERERLGREISSAEGALNAATSKLQNPEFTSRAPERVVAQQRERAAILTERIRQLRERLDSLSG